MVLRGRPSLFRLYRRSTAAPGPRPRLPPLSFRALSLRPEEFLFRHAILFPSVNQSRMRSGQLNFCDHRVEFFALSKSCKKPKRLAIGYDRTRETVKGRRVLGRHPPLDMGIGREFQN